MRHRIPRPSPFSLRYVGVFKLRGGYATLSQDVTNALVVLLPNLSPRIVIALHRRSFQRGEIATILDETNAH